MSRYQALIDATQSVMGDAGEPCVNTVEALKQVEWVEAVVRGQPITAGDIPADAAITKRFTATTKHLPMLEVLGKAILGITQTGGDVLVNPDGFRELIIAGIEPDVDYAIYLCHLLEGALGQTWAEHATTPEVKEMLPKVRSTYRRTFQRNRCNEIRRHLIDITAQRLTQLQPPERELMVRKREIAASAAEETRRVVTG